MAHHAQFYIGGRWVDPATPATLDVIDPATEQPFTMISAGSAADVDRAVAAARAAFADLFAIDPRIPARPAAPHPRRLQRAGGRSRERRYGGNGRADRFLPRRAGLGRTRPSRGDHRGARSVRIQPAARDEPDRQGADRGRGADHAVELAVEPDRLQGRAGACGGLHGRPEAERDRPDQRHPVRRDRRGGRRAGGRLQPCQRHGAGRRPGHGGRIRTWTWCPSPARPGPGSSSPRPRPTPSSASPRSSAASRRTSFCATRISPPRCEAGTLACFSNSGQSCDAPTRMLVPAGAARRGGRDRGDRGRRAEGRRARMRRASISGPSSARRSSTRSSG